MKSSHSFERIVIPFDNSPSSRVALRTAVNFAGRFLADLSFIHVRTGREDAEELAEVHRVIDKIKQKTGLNIELLRPEGQIHKEIVRLAASVNADLIIMGTHGTKGFEEFWIGSNAFRVVSSTERPVMTMQESYPKEGFDRILIPIDDSKDSRQKIPMTISLAKSFSAEVIILGTSRYEDDETQGKIKKYVKQAVDLISAEGIITSQQFHYGTNIADSTLSFAKGANADLIIMMSENEPTSGFFMGTNAQRVVNHSKIPVLTIHTKDIRVGNVGY